LTKIYFFVKNLLSSKIKREVLFMSVSSGLQVIAAKAERIANTVYHEEGPALISRISQEEVSQIQSELDEVLKKIKKIASRPVGGGG
jgi:hypothetical protein